MTDDRPTPLWDIACLFLKLGTTAFGGPAAHIAMLQHEVVERRGWLSRDQFLDHLGASNLIPGPTSTELVIHIGRKRGGWPGLLVAGTRVNLLRNSLVLIAPAGSRLSGLSGLAARDVRVVALGDPASVPAGQYGKQTLVALHLWEKVSGKLVLGKDVRQVLSYVETGNADAGLVYATDAQSSTKVRVAETVPDGLHDAIVYPMAVVKGTRNEQAARAFAEYLRSAEAAAVFTKYGFRMATQ